MKPETDQIRALKADVALARAKLVRLIASIDSRQTTINRLEAKLVLNGPVSVFSRHG